MSATKLLSDSENIEPQNLQRATVKKTDSYFRNGRSRLQDLVAKGDAEGIELLLNSLGEDDAQVELNKRSGVELSTPLHEAAMLDEEECAKVLLKKGAGHDIPDREGATAIHYAAFYGSELVLKLLLNAGADIHLKDKDGTLPMHKAAYGGHLACLKKLKKKDKTLINILDNFKSTPLHCATLRNFGTCVHYLLSHGATVDAVDKEGSTPLHKAAYNGSLDCVQQLIEAKANVNAQDKGLCTPLHYAAEMGHKEVCNFLIEKGAHANAKDSTGITPLHNACFYGRIDCVSLLLEKGAVVDILENQTNPIHHAAFAGQFKILSLLIERKANVNAKDSEGASALHKAVYNGHLDCAKLLLDHDADPNLQDEEGSTPLHIAAFSGQLQCMQVLLEKKAKVDARDSDDGTPLHSVAFGGHIECLKLLVSLGAEVNAKDVEGYTPLHQAVRRGNKTCASYLLKNGAKVDAVNEQGLSPLHFAARYPPCVRRLLKANANVNLQDASLRTPLFYAVKLGIEESARILIFRGADLTIQDKEGKSPLTVSKILNKSVLELIVKEKAELAEAQTHKEFKLAVKKFNAEPKVGINYLIESQILKKQPDSIAKFLHTAEGLNKTKIGEYLGRLDAVETLHAYIDRIDFTKFEFDLALRYMLSKFRLPSEAQQIDRIMESFAKKFCKDNPHVFSHPDTAYLLAFSIIMLNTDIHNPNVAKKMTLDDWKKNNRGINGGEDLPSEYLTKFYNRILKEEIKFEPDTEYTNAEMKGYMVKQDTEPVGIVPLENVEVRRIENSRKYTFGIFAPEKESEIKAIKFDSKGNPVTGHHDVYVVSCNSEQELEEWMKAIQSNVFKNPLADLIAKKLQKQKTTKAPKERRDSGSRVKSQTLTDLNVTFKRLLELAGLCSLIYQDTDSVLAKLGGNTHFGTIGKHHNYIAVVNNDTKKQFIILASKYWSSPKSLRKDLALWSDQRGEGAKDPTSYYKINLNDTVKMILTEIQSQLKPNYNTVITGYSLIGVIAPELAKVMSINGFKIRKVVTFGTPKWFNKDSIAEYSKMSLIRVIDIRDPVSGLFPGKVAPGIEIVLLSDRYHTNADNREEIAVDDSLLDDVVDTEDFECHSIDYYLSRIQPKVKQSTLVSYNDRFKYK